MRSSKDIVISTFNAEAAAYLRTFLMGMFVASVLFTIYGRFYREMTGIEVYIDPKTNDSIITTRIFYSMLEVFSAIFVGSILYYFSRVHAVGWLFLLILLVIAIIEISVMHQFVLILPVALYSPWLLNVIATGIDRSAAIRTHSGRL